MTEQPRVPHLTPPSPSPGPALRAGPDARDVPAFRGYQPRRTPVLPQAPTRLATATVAIAAAVTLAQVALLLATLHAAASAASGRAGGGPAAGTTAVDVTGLLVVLAQVGAFVVTCGWLSAARAFAQAASEVGHVRGGVWVWLGWVVPIVNLWFPYQVVRDVAAGTGVRPRATLGLWWGCWLAAMLLGNVEAFGAQTASRLDVAADLGATAATLAAFALWARVVRAVAARQAAWPSAAR
ncbi:DUF4328 domain-containing protein [Xylanimonas ulmi]|uniref:Uncharacterized protein DUF4328 n=1 Tax=Xylanimonas ulmi TaxID=228973 RepID=A0A4Q7M3B4_9MICO|nr:DUF4328 domain-containing protein [Xylanibacterium ulmi]RZS61347.1 uncharacterized protein DUF4328 [Xylanibacterium ulmi]